MVDYFATFNGNKIIINDFKEEDILLDDIAHHLANIKRYGGAQPLNTTYSVAQHCLVMAEYFLKVYADEEMAKLALLHDASEAYLGDIVSGLKGYLPDYATIESRFQSVIQCKYGLWPDNKKYMHVKALDKGIIVNEVRAIFPINQWNIWLGGKQRKNKGVMGIHINPFRCPVDVKKDYLEMCDRLGIKDE